MEGLGEIVVGAGVEARHLLVPRAPRGEDQHRRGHPPLAPALQDRHPVDLGQAQVQDHRVVRLLLAEVERLLPVRGMIHRITGVRQRALKLAGDIGIVFDKQDSHSSSLCRRMRPDESIAPVRMNGT
jgi:hypothetical protein